MKKVICVCCVFFFIMSACENQQPEINTEKLDTYLDLIGRNYQDMGEVVIRKGGNVLYHRSFGPDGVVIPAKKEVMMYRIGSISKMFVAIMAFQMEEEGMLSLDDTLDLYFPEVPNSDKITISHLLGHTSGLKNIVVKNDSIIDWLYHPVSTREILDEIIRQGTLFDPGENSFYSNSGFYLLTRILESKSGKDFPELLSERVLMPLKLIHTVGGAEDGPGIAIPYKLNYKTRQWVETPDFYFPNIQGVGDVASNPADMAEIIDGLFVGKFVTENSLEQMKPIPGQFMGKGLFFVPFNEEVFYGHSGGTFGAYAMLMHNEKDGLTVALTLNGQEMMMNDLLIGLLTITYGLEFELPEFDVFQEQFDPEKYVQWEGVYSSEDFPLKLTVFRQGDELYMQGTGQTPFVLNQIAENKFIRKDLALETEFPEDEGVMSFTQYGRNWILTRE